jgi:hypothetical protein
MTREKIYSHPIVRYTGRITATGLQEFMVNEQDERSIGEFTARKAQNLSPSRSPLSTQILNNTIDFREIYFHHDNFTFFITFSAFVQ